MKTFYPKVSIIIPVYNGSNYMKEAIDSALAQTYGNIEILVVNDGSTDGGATEKIAKSYGNKIRYIYQENGGVASALNHGIKDMEGEYFSWLSHDDLYLPNRVSSMVNSLSSSMGNTSNTIVATSYAYFNQSGIFAKVSPAGNVNKNKHPLFFLFSGYINGCALLIPKKSLTDLGGFDESLPTTQDFDLWFRLFRKNKLLFLDKELTLSRSHDEQGSKVMLSDHVVECDRLWINMSEQLTDYEKVAIFGSVLDFYYNIYYFLCDNTLYEDSKLYYKRKMLTHYKDQLFFSKKPKVYKKIGIIDQKNSRYVVKGVDKKGRKTIYFPIYGDYNDRGGLNKMVAMIANSLSEKYNVIVSSYFANKSGYDLNKNVSYLKLATRSTQYSALVDASLMFDVDLTIVSHNCSLDALEAISSMQKEGIKVISWNHEDFFLPYHNTDFFSIWPVRNEIFSKADAVIWLTNASCKAYSLINNNGLVIPNCIEFKGLKSSSASNPKINKKLIAIARFDDPRKRANLLIETYEKLLEKRSDIKLMILGQMDLDMSYTLTENIGQAIKRLNKTKENIQVVGFVRDVERYYNQGDINILPSYNEGFGLTILEAAFFGVPTAVFDNSGFDDIIKNGVDGIIVDDADTSQLADGINDLYEHEDKLVSMKRNTKDINVRFGKDGVILQWKQLLNDIFSEKPISFCSYSLNADDIKKISKGYSDSVTFISKRVGELSITNVHLKATVINIEQQIDGIRHSLSWVITKPARLVKKSLVKVYKIIEAMEDYI